MCKRRKRSELIMLGAVAVGSMLPVLPASGSGGPIKDPIPEPLPKGDIRVKLLQVADGLVAPIWGTFPLADQGVRDERLFVVDQKGDVWAVNTHTGNRMLFHDVRDRLVELGIGGKGTFDERGLLGLAFHPHYYDNGLVYTYTSEPDSSEPDFSTMPDGVDPNHQSVIREWHVPNPRNPDSVVDPDSSREILRLDQPQFNHNAGCINFGPNDELLYIAFGDGGRADDQGIGHGDFGNGRDPSNPLGALLRIDPQGNNSANGKYGIPQDNPFVGKQGFVEEIYAYGFRNPFRFSFDHQSGVLWLGDVGQNDIEEIDLVFAGGNYGWNWKEGTFFFDPNGNDRGFVTLEDNGAPDDLIDPIAQYDHDEGLAVLGGFVHRGNSESPLHERYIFGDFARTFSNDGRLFYLGDGAEVLEFHTFGAAGLNRSLLGFGQDINGEVYALTNRTGTPFEETGEVLHLVAVERAPITDVLNAFGRVVENGLKAIREADGLNLGVESGFGNNLKEVHKVELLIGAESPVSTPEFLDIAVISQVDQPIGVQKVAIRNWHTGEFETIGITMLSNTPTTHLLEDIAASGFVRDSDGRVELRIRTIVMAPFIAFHFINRTDLVEVGVR